MSLKKEIKNLKKENEKLRKENEELKKDKESLIDKISKRLLELKFEKHTSIKSKCLKWIVKKILPDYKEWKTQSKIKPIKNWEKTWNNVLFGV